jgi:hypothetical protein
MTLIQSDNGFDEYKRLIEHEFKTIHKELDILKEQGDERALRLQAELSSLLERVEERIINRVDRLETAGTHRIEKVENGLGVIKLDVNTLKVKAGMYGAGGGVVFSLIMKLLEILPQLPGN